MSWIIAGACLLLAAWAGFFAARDKPVILKQLIAGAVIEVLLIAQLVVVGIGIGGGHTVAEPATLWGYLIVALVILPLADVWAFAERTRWSSVVMLVAAVAVAAMQARIVSLWGAA